jgi:hypothetical protein
MSDLYRKSAGEQFKEVRFYVFHPFQVSWAKSLYITVIHLELPLIILAKHGLEQKPFHYTPTRQTAPHLSESESHTLQLATS